MELKAKYFNLSSFYYGVFLALLDENYQAKGAISVSVTEDTAYQIKPLFINYVTSKSEIIATIDDVNNAITGAINSSY